MLVASVVLAARALADRTNSGNVLPSERVTSSPSTV
jgi:hypothetical protein